MGQASLLLLPFVLGFSTSLVIMVLNRLITGVEAFFGRTHEGLEGLAVVPDGSMVFVADGSRGQGLPYNRVRQIAKRW